ncbi:putative aldo-keto reductase 1 [Geobacter sp. OR-1]|uniref:aldo/keto reductase n=1 Tax=Geobacter sp. OR-1 TaxID=1266765 RepID=UPI00054349B0|nr:aldo/keto reductase [Geobacter sp. OR-1]GAM08099.1 putative aldo-keto reductase 1 [Geobacter sp. OR-1]
MQQVILGRTGISVSRLVYGTLPMGPLQAALSPEEGGRLIRHALEQGITMLDTAELYGSYPHIRAGVEGYRGQLTIVSKTHAPDAATARSHVERGLRELGRERIDIVHCHAARVADPFVDRSEVIEALLKMRDEGKIGHVGLSTHYISAVRKAARHPEIEVVHPLINRTGMGIIDGTAEEMSAAISDCAASGTGIYAMKALAGGNLISSARESIGYVLGLPGVHAVALGMLSTEEIEANVRLFSTGGIDPDVWQQLESRTRHLRIMERFCKGCGQCVPACVNGALSLVNDKATVDEGVCVLCGYCGAACPEFIIRVV